MDPTTKPHRSSSVAAWIEYAIARFEYYHTTFSYSSIQGALREAVRDVETELQRYRLGIVYTGDIEHHATEEYNRGYRDGLAEAHSLSTGYATGVNQRASHRSRNDYWTGLDDA